MQAVILDGGREGDATCDAARAVLVAELAERGWSVESIRLAERSIKPCVGCFGCWFRTPGECVQADDGREVARAMARSDALVLLTPLSFGGYGRLLKTALDRVIPNILPWFTTRAGEMHHVMRYPNRQSLLGVGVQREPDAEGAAIFRELLERNGLNMDSPVIASVVLRETDDEASRRAELRDLVGKLGGVS